jgi:hypothetical protein
MDKPHRKVNVDYWYLICNRKKTKGLQMITPTTEVIFLKNMPAQLVLKIRHRIVSRKIYKVDIVKRIETLWNALCKTSHYVLYKINNIVHMI